MTSNNDTGNASSSNSPKWVEQKTRARYIGVGDLLVSESSGTAWTVVFIDSAAGRIDAVHGSDRQRTDCVDPDEPLTVLVNTQRASVEDKLTAIVPALRDVAADLSPTDRARLIEALQSGGAA